MSILVPDNDLPHINRGLSHNSVFFLTVAKTSRENLQVPDCNRYQRKTPATLIPLPHIYANNML